MAISTDHLKYSQPVPAGQKCFLGTRDENCLA